MTIPLDKLLHLLAGWAIAATLLPHMGDATAMVIVAAVALAKEVVYDKLLNKGTPDPGDFAVTVLGGVLALLAGVVLGSSL